jgi:hypothetical protein
VWDTVDAYGMPVEELKIGIDRYIWPLALKDRELDPAIEKACHALSIDDARTSFHPLLWDESGCSSEPSAKHTDHHKLTQVWFAGVHSNVGGGYPDDGLSCVSLRWMMREARKRGLIFNTRAIEDIETGAALFGRLYDSRDGFGAYYRYQPRRLDPPLDKQNACIPHPKIHESVIQRMVAGTDAYAPLGLPRNFRIVLDDREPADLQRERSPAGGHGHMPNIYNLADYKRLIQEGSQLYGTTAEPRIDWKLKERVAANIDALQKPDEAAIELIWDTVWWRRILQLATLMMTIFLLVYPLLPSFRVSELALWAFHSEVLLAVGSLLQPLALAVIDIASLMLPTSAKPLLDMYRFAPWNVVGIALLLGTLLIWGRLVDRRIHDRALAGWNSNWRAKRNRWLRRNSTLRVLAGLLMTLIFGSLFIPGALFAWVFDLFTIKGWADLVDSNYYFTLALINFFVVMAFGIFTVVGLASIVDGLRLSLHSEDEARELPSFPLWIARKLRKSAAAVAFYRGVAHHVVPMVFAFALVVLGVALLNRFAFAVMSAGGWICHATQSEKTETLIRIGDWKEFLFHVERGCQPLNLALNAGVTYEVTVSSIKEPTGARVFAEPMRRWFSRPWFVPIIRVGSLGAEEYADTEKPWFGYVMKIQPKNDGQMFVFINEAVIGLPKVWDVFYRQNKNPGTARIKVTKMADAPAR